MPKGIDEELAENLKHAEEHLIAAVELFSRDVKPERREGYQARLIQAQETITTLYREELVRIRGPQRPGRKKKR
jgi:hypothetical protein